MYCCGARVGVARRCGGEIRRIRLFVTKNRIQFSVEFSRFVSCRGGFVSRREASILRGWSELIETVTTITTMRTATSSN